MNQIVALDKNKHRRHNILTGDLSRSETHHVCQVYVSEFSVLAGECPIIFLKSKDGDALESCALLGITPGKNLFWQEGKWQGAYIPATLRAYPFYLHYKDSIGINPIICIDASSISLNDFSGVGQRLFNDSGDATPTLLEASNLLRGIHQQKIQSREFIRCLTEMDLFQEQVVTVDLPANTKHNLTGVFCVTKERISELSNSDFLCLREKGYLTAIYAHMFSLHQSGNLSQLFKKYQARVLH
ncbi:hypothetical protein GCM10027180_20280 [Microbulbifer echini]